MEETTVVLALVNGRPECAFSDPQDAQRRVERLRAGLPGSEVRAFPIPLYGPEPFDAES